MSMEVKYSTKMAESLQYRALENFLYSHQYTRSLLCEHETPSSINDRSYNSNEEFWDNVIAEELRAPEVVRLVNFRIFEWIPRNPGLFHTPEAAWHREDALRNISRIRGTPEAFMELSESLPDHASGDVTGKLTLGEKADRIEIFNPIGKMSMIEGGIGCVRLRPIYLGGRMDQEYFVFSATSNQHADEGIPILVSSDLAGLLMADIKQKGYSARSEIVGRTRYIPKELSDIYSSNHGIPRLYVELEEIGERDNIDDRGYVSVASSFVGEFEKERGIYATYVTFDPGWPGARNGAAKWLREEYVSGLYQGYLVTDFDEIAPEISDTLFSLGRVQSDGDLAKLIDELKNLHGYFDWEMLDKARIKFEHTQNKYETHQNIQAGGNSNITQVGRDFRDG